MLLQAAAQFFIPLAVLCAPGDRPDPDEELIRLGYEAKILRSLPLSAGDSLRVRQALLLGFEDQIIGAGAEEWKRWTREQKQDLYDIYSRDVLGALRADGVVDRQGQIADILEIKNPEAAADELAGILGKGSAADRGQIRRHVGVLPGNLTPAAAERLLRAITAWVGSWKIPARPDGSTAADLGLLLEIANRITGLEDEILKRSLATAASKFLDELAGRFAGGSSTLESRILLLEEIGPLLESIRFSKLTPKEFQDVEKFSERLKLSRVRGKVGQIPLGEVRYIEARPSLGKILGTVPRAEAQAEWAYTLAQAGGSNFALCLIYRDADTSLIRALAIQRSEKAGAEVKPPWPGRSPGERIYIYNPQGGDLSRGHLVDRKPWTIREVILRFKMHLDAGNATEEVFAAITSLRDRSNLGSIEALGPGIAIDESAVKKAAMDCDRDQLLGAGPFTITLSAPGEAPGRPALVLLGKLLDRTAGETFPADFVVKALEYLDSNRSPAERTSAFLLGGDGSLVLPPAAAGGGNIEVRIFTAIPVEVREPREGNP